jgi:RNA polymerase sigma factor (sigma-70 family)
LANSTVAEIFEQEYENFVRYLKGRFNRLSEYDAEDIIQLTVLKILRKGDDALSIRNMTSYMYSSLRNSAIDYMKKSKYEVLTEDDYDSTVMGAEEEVLKEELKMILKEAIDSLDEKSKYIFIQTEIMGRSYKELCDETGIKLGTLLSRKSRATVKIKKTVSDYLVKEAIK